MASDLPARKLIFAMRLTIITNGLHVFRKENLSMALRILRGTPQMEWDEYMIMMEMFLSEVGPGIIMKGQVCMRSGWFGALLIQISL